MTRWLLVTLAAAGCLEVPKGPPHECSVDSDCNTGAGEVCDEGVCYGDPPMGAFAATLTAPLTRTDVIATEIPMLSLAPNGWLDALTLEAPVTISGRIEAYCPAAQQNCSTQSIAAEIRFTRPSRFPGGPALRLSAQSKGGQPRGTDSFSIKIPRTQEGESPYTVTIDPEGGGEQPPSDGNAHPAELVPPKRLTLYASEDSEHQTYTLGRANPVTISGTLKDALGTALVSYRVVALGRWDASTAKTKISTVDYVSNGQYSITLAENVVGPVELVATPFEANVVAPALHLTSMSPITQTRALGQPSGLGSPVVVKIAVTGLAGDGRVTPVTGARVIIAGAVDATLPGAARAELTAEAITGDDGIAKLTLLDGPSLVPTYLLRVVPPASSKFGIVYNAVFSIAAPEPVRLPSRIVLSGQVVDIAGHPLADVSVTARRSLRFLWSLDLEDQDFLDEIPASTTITLNSGDFSVWVDPSLADAWGHYDLTFETPKGSRSPNWRLSEIEIPRVAGQTAVALDVVTIPDAAYIHGKIVDPHGDPVEGSALRIYQLPAASSFCEELSHAPEDCELDALVVGNGESDALGVVRLTLPRP